MFALYIDNEEEEEEKTRTRKTKENARVFFSSFSSLPTFLRVFFQKKPVR